MRWLDTPCTSIPTHEHGLVLKIKTQDFERPKQFCHPVKSLATESLPSKPLSELQNSHILGTSFHPTRITACK